MSACADLTTEHIQPILSNSSISQVDNAVNQSCRSILMYFCMYDLTLLFISVFHRCDSFGHDPWNPRTRQWSAVCSSEYNQFEVGLSVTLWASGHNNGQWFLSHLFNHRFISSGVSYWNTHILSFFHSFEVGSCIAVQVCMIQIPILVLFNIFYVSGFGYAFFDADILQIFSDSCINVTIFLWQDVGFVLIFSDLHLWASIFSVIVVNYIFMDGKSDYFQGKS